MTILKEHARPPVGYHFAETNRLPDERHRAKGNLVHLRANTNGTYYAACDVYGVHRCRPREGDRLCRRCERIAASPAAPEGTKP